MIKKFRNENDADTTQAFIKHLLFVEYHTKQYKHITSLSHPKSHKTEVL